MENLNLKDVIDLGMTAILLYINRDLWMRLNQLQDRLFEYLEEGRKARHAATSDIAALKLEVERLEALNSPRTNKNSPN